MSFREVEFCDICGMEIGEEGSFELCDGSMCQACADKLSPWFEDCDCADIDEIKEQLNSREENREKVRFFHTSRRFGQDIQVAIDDAAKCFMVITTDDPVTENPDVISFEEVIDCTVTALETKEELDREDGDGNSVVQYSYDFELEIDLDHPFLDHITFLLNPEPLVLESSKRSFLGFGGFDPEEDPTYAGYMSLGQRISDILLDMEDEES